MTWMMHWPGKKCDSTHPDASDGKQAAGAEGSQTEADQNI